MEKKESSEIEEEFRVVLAVDDSKHSEFAFNYYLEEVHRPHFKLYTIHCAEVWDSCQPMDGGPSPGRVQELKQKEKKTAEALKQKFTKVMAEKQVKGEFEVVSGSQDIWARIISYQEQIGARLIVVGTRGSSVIRRTLLGSVSDSVVHHAHCPVLLCGR